MLVEVLVVLVVSVVVVVAAAALIELIAYGIIQLVDSRSRLFKYKTCFLLIYSINCCTVCWMQRTRLAVDLK